MSASSSKTTPAKTSTTSTAAKPTEDLTKKIEKLEIRTKAVNTNDIARVANSKLQAPDGQLHPLVGLKTNRPIDKFPATPKDINRLNENQLDAILLALEAGVSGKKEAKVEKLRLQIGLKPTPV